MVTAIQREYVARLSVALDAAALPDGRPCPQVARPLVIAHGAFESGWGKAKAARLAHNHWNLTRGANDARPIIHGSDKEPGPDGGWRMIVQRFRAYGSDLEAVEDYFRFLGEMRRYAPAWKALLQGNAVEFVRALREDDPATRQIEGGFYTAPLAEYQQGFAGCLSVVREVLRDEAHFHAVAELARARAEKATKDPV